MKKTLFALNICYFLFIGNAYATCPIERMSKPSSDKESALSKSAFEKVNLARSYLTQEPKNIDKAIELLEQASQEDPYTTVSFSRYYLNGTFGEGNKENGIKVLKERAENLDTLTKPKLATLYLHLGKVFLDEDNEFPWVRDDEKGAEWISKASECGHYTAENKIPMLYIEGRGVEQNIEKGVKALIKLSENRYSKADKKLANIYLNGIGVEKNIKEAIKWFTHSANRGERDSSGALAKIYYEGTDGIKNHYVEAYARAFVAGHYANPPKLYSLQVDKGTLAEIEGVTGDNHLAEGVPTLTMITEKLSPEKLEEAKELAEFYEKQCKR